MSALEQHVFVPIWCPHEKCDQLAEIYDALEIPANQTSCGHDVMLIRSRCLAGHNYHGELTGRIELAVAK